MNDERVFVNFDLILEVILDQVNRVSEVVYMIGNGCLQEWKDGVLQGEIPLQCIRQVIMWPDSESVAIKAEDVESRADIIELTPTGMKDVD